MDINTSNILSLFNRLAIKQNEFGDFTEMKNQIPSDFGVNYTSMFTPKSYADFNRYNTSGVNFKPTDVAREAISPISQNLSVVNSPLMTGPKVDASGLKPTNVQSPPSARTGGIKNMSSGMQSGLNMAGSLLGGMSGDKLDPGQKATREGIRSAIGSFGPWGAAIAAASGVVDMVGEATGLNLDNIDKAAAKRAGISSSAVGLNNLANTLPGVSMFAGIGAKKTDKALETDIIQDYRGGYSGTVGDLSAAGALSEKRISGTGALNLIVPGMGFLFGGRARKKANAFIQEANRKARLTRDIGEQSDLRKSSTYGEELASQNYNRYLGQQGGHNMVVGKLGMKFPALEEAREILKNYNVQTISKEDEIEKFAEGGKMNVIAQGALHSRKNHLNQIHENLEDITPKGIPVVSLEEGGEIQQHAEIEGGELILTKELTIKLEELYKDGSEEAMIEAGKLLSEEIVENTDDKTNEILNDEDND